ncbi:hypothetical protein GV51_0354 [Gardnerella vaginalis 5-1]|nr:hypothetical protein GV51_0354 [Gardnerella vaginalis 5-1]
MRIKVERKTQGIVLECEQLVCHAAGQSGYVRNAVTSRNNIANFLRWHVGRLIRVNKPVERFAYQGGINR